MSVGAKAGIPSRDEIPCERTGPAGRKPRGEQAMTGAPAFAGAGSTPGTLSRRTHARRSARRTAAGSAAVPAATLAGSGRGTAGRAGGIRCLARRDARGVARRTDRGGTAGGGRTRSFRDRSGPVAKIFRTRLNTIPTFLGSVGSLVPSSRPYRTIRSGGASGSRIAEGNRRSRRAASLNCWHRPSETWHKAKVEIIDTENKVTLDTEHGRYRLSPA